MGRDQTPIPDAEEAVPPVNQDRDQPQGHLCASAQKRRPHQQPDRNGCADCEPKDRTPHDRIVTAGQHEERYVSPTNEPVYERETKCTVAERLGNGVRDYKEGGHHSEHDESNRAFLRLDDAGQPGITHPGPPQHGQHHHAPADAGPGGIGRDQGGALGEPEHEDQVEEQLERSDRLSLPQLGTQPRCSATAVLAIHHAGDSMVVQSMVVSLFGRTGKRLASPPTPHACVCSNAGYVRC